MADAASSSSSVQQQEQQEQEQQLKEINAKGARAYDAFCDARDEWEILDAEYGSEDEDTERARQAVIQAQAELDKANEEFVKFVEKKKKTTMKIEGDGANA